MVNAAVNLTNKIEMNIMRLKDFPLSCSLVEDDILKNKGKVLPRSGLVYGVV